MDCLKENVVSIPVLAFNSLVVLCQAHCFGYRQPTIPLARRTGEAPKPGEHREQGSMPVILGSSVGRRSGIGVAALNSQLALAAIVGEQEP